MSEQFGDPVLKFAANGWGPYFQRVGNTWVQGGGGGSREWVRESRGWVGGGGGRWGIQSVGGGSRGWVGDPEGFHGYYNDYYTFSVTIKALILFLIATQQSFETNFSLALIGPDQEYLSIVYL